MKSKLPLFIPALLTVFILVCIVLVTAPHQTVQAQTGAAAPVPINISSVTTVKLVTGITNRQVYITHVDLAASIADNVAIVEGTGATCGTNTAGMAGGATAATGWNLTAAQPIIAIGDGMGTVLRTATPGDSVCIITSSAAQLSGNVMYQQ